MRRRQERKAVNGFQMVCVCRQTDMLRERETWGVGGGLAGRLQMPSQFTIPHMTAVAKKMENVCLCVCFCVSVCMCFWGGGVCVGLGLCSASMILRLSCIGHVTVTRSKHLILKSTTIQFEPKTNKILCMRP